MEPEDPVTVRRSGVGGQTGAYAANLPHSLAPHLGFGVPGVGHVGSRCFLTGRNFRIRMQGRSGRRVLWSLGCRLRLGECDLI